MRILSIDGGGYLGLATAAFIAEVERHFNSSFHKTFDLFCGTSTGAIIALALAKGLSGKEVCGLYQDFGPKVFWNPVPGFRKLRFLLGLVRARYSNAPLRKALEGAFGDISLGDLRKRIGKKAVVTAFSITGGRPRVFKTDHAQELTRDDGYRLSDIALASAAAPVFLPLVKLTSPTNGSVEEFFCDGGVFANHPALIGYAEALYHLQAQPNQVKVLSLSTPRSDHSERESAKGFIQRHLISRGLVSWGSKLASVLIDSTSMIAHETLRRLASRVGGPEAVYERVELSKPLGVEMDTATGAATKTLLHLGTDVAATSDMRNRLQPFFARS